jgi:hemerythrin-like domain-containing protein
MPVQIGAPRESSFTSPLGLLSDCHRRIERFLGVLTQISSRAGQPLQAQERVSLETALAYFREAAPKHTADEEESLFPRLRASGAGEAQLAALESDHQIAARDHAAAEFLATRWMAGGTLEESDAAAFRETVERLQALYAHHIAVEETELFPLAGRVLDADALTGVGREMAARRGLRAD